MKVVTFNIRCDYKQDGKNNFNYRKPYIVNKINKEGPDVICFQEVLPHVALWLKENLHDYYIVGCGRDEKFEDEQMTIAYKKLRFNLMGMEVFWLSETPKLVATGYPDQSICPRICTEILIQDLKTKESFRIINTHLDHVGREARRQSLIQLFEKVRNTHSFLGTPVILVGDFNALPESPEMEVLKQYEEFVDVTKNIKGTFHDYGQVSPAEKIDYIIAQDTIGFREVNLWDEVEEGVYLSDHYPISVELCTD